MANVFRLTPSPIKKATSLAQDPSPFCEFYFPPLERLVAVVQALNTLLQALASIRKLVNLCRRRRSHGIAELVYGSHLDFILLDL